MGCFIHREQNWRPIKAIQVWRAPTSASASISARFLKAMGYSIVRWGGNLAKQRLVNVVDDEDDDDDDDDHDDHDDHVLNKHP